MEKIRRMELYNESFPKYPPLVHSNGWVYGVWMLGQNYKGSGYYGSYPPTYLKRIMSMFPDAKDVLQLFSGSLTEDVIGDRLDVNPDLNPDICVDAHYLSDAVKKKYDLVLADPPYSNEDANKYGTSMVNRNKVIKECSKVLKQGGNLIWLDQVLPMFRKDDLSMWLTIGLVRSTNHRFRVVVGFEKL